MRTNHRVADMRLLALVVFFMLVFIAPSFADGEFPFLSVDPSQRQSIMTGIQMQWYLFKGYTTGANGIAALYYVALAATLVGALSIIFNKGFHDIKTIGAWFLLVIVCIFAPYNSKLLFYPVTDSSTPTAATGVTAETPKGFTPQLAALHVGSTLQIIFIDMFKSKQFDSLVDAAIAGISLSSDKNLLSSGYVENVMNYKTRCKDNGAPILPTNLIDITTGTGTGGTDLKPPPDTFETIFKNQILSTAGSDASVNSNFGKISSINLYHSTSLLPEGADKNSYISGVKALYNNVFYKNVEIAEGGASAAGSVSLNDAVTHLLRGYVDEGALGISGGEVQYHLFHPGSIFFYLDDGALPDAGVQSLPSREARMRINNQCQRSVGCADALRLRDAGLKSEGRGGSARLGDILKMIEKEKTSPGQIGLGSMPTTVRLFSAGTVSKGSTSAPVVTATKVNVPCSPEEANKLFGDMFDTEFGKSASGQLLRQMIEGTGMPAGNPPRFDVLKTSVSVPTNIAAMFDNMVRYLNNMADAGSFKGLDDKERKKMLANLVFSKTWDSTRLHSASQASLDASKKYSVMDPSNIGILGKPLGEIAKVGGVILTWFASLAAGGAAVAVIYFLQIMIEIVLMAVLLMTPLLFLFGIAFPNHAAGLIIQSVMFIFIPKLVPVTFVVIDRIGTVIFRAITISGDDVIFKQSLFLIAIAGLYAGLLGMTMLLLFKIGDAQNIQKLQELDKAAEQAAEAGMKVATAIATTVAAMGGAGLISAMRGNGPEEAKKAMAAVWKDERAELSNAIGGSAATRILGAATKDGQPEEQEFEERQKAAEEQYRKLTGKTGDLNAEDMSMIQAMRNAGATNEPGSTLDKMNEKYAELEQKKIDAATAEVRQHHRLGKDEGLDSQQLREVGELVKNGKVGADAQAYLNEKRGAPWAATKARFEEDASAKVRDFHGMDPDAKLEGDLKADALALADAEMNSTSPIDANRFLNEKMVSRNVERAQAAHQATMAAIATKDMDNASRAKALKDADDKLNDLVKDHFTSMGIATPSIEQLAAQKRLMQQGMGVGSGSLGGGGGTGGVGGVSGAGPSAGPVAPSSPSAPTTSPIATAASATAAASKDSWDERANVLNQMLEELKGIRSGVTAKISDSDTIRTKTKLEESMNKMSQDQADMLLKAQIKENNERRAQPPAAVPSAGLRFLSGATGAFLAGGGLSKIPGIGDVLKEVANEWSEGPGRARVWAQNGGGIKGMMQWFGARDKAASYEAIKKAQQPYGAAAEYVGMGEAGAFNSAVKQATLAAAQAVAKAQSTQRAIEIKSADIKVLQDSARKEGKDVPPDLMNWESFKNADLVQAIESLESTLNASAMLNGGKVMVGDGKQNITLSGRTIHELVSAKGHKQVQDQLEGLLGGHMYLVTKDGKPGALSRRRGDIKGIQDFIQGEVDIDYQPGALEKWYNGKGQFFGLQGRADKIKMMYAEQEQLKREWSAKNPTASPTAKKAFEKTLSVNRFHNYQYEQNYSQMVTNNFRAKIERPLDDISSEIKRMADSVKNAAAYVDKFAQNLSKMENFADSLSVDGSIKAKLREVMEGLERGGRSAMMEVGASYSKAQTVAAILERAAEAAGKKFDDTQIHQFANEAYKRYF